jgi:hypothetical protein
MFTLTVDSLIQITITTNILYLTTLTSHYRKLKLISLQLTLANHHLCSPIIRYNFSGCALPFFEVALYGTFRVGLSASHHCNGDVTCRLGILLDASRLFSLIVFLLKIANEKSVFGVKKLLKCYI